jgi:hypothetical protein
MWVASPVSPLVDRTDQRQFGQRALARGRRLEIQLLRRQRAVGDCSCALLEYLVATLLNMMRMSRPGVSILASSAWVNGLCSPLPSSAMVPPRQNRQRPIGLVGLIAERPQCLHHGVAVEVHRQLDRLRPVCREHPPPLWRRGAGWAGKPRSGSRSRRSPAFRGCCHVMAGWRCLRLAEGETAPAGAKRFNEYGRSDLIPNPTPRRPDVPVTGRGSLISIHLIARPGREIPLTPRYRFGRGRSCACRRRLCV